MKTPQTGRGLSPLPVRDFSACVHDVNVADECRACEREIPRARRSRKLAGLQADLLLSRLARGEGGAPDEALTDERSPSEQKRALRDREMGASEP